MNGSEKALVYVNILIRQTHLDPLPPPSLQRFTQQCAGRSILPRYMQNLYFMKDWNFPGKGESSTPELVRCFRPWEGGGQ